MSLFVCPNCGSRLEPIELSSGPTVSCLKCGWNSGSAHRKFRKEVLGWVIWPIVTLLGLGFLLMFQRRDVLAALFFIVLVGAVKTATLRRRWKDLRKLNSAPSSPGLGLDSGAPHASDAFLKLLPGQEEARDIFSNVLNIEKPRPIKWSWRIRLAVAGIFLTVFAAVYLIGYFALGPGNREDYPGAIVVMIFLVWVTGLIGAPVIPDLANRKLICEGEIAVGRVVQQRMISRGRTSWSSIHYAFVDSGRRGFTDDGVDYSDALGEGAPVVVFYDPLDPNHNVALECSRFSLKSSN